MSSEQIRQAIYDLLRSGSTNEEIVAHLQEHASYEDLVLALIEYA